MTEPIVTKFCVVYDGPAHENHEINIMTLGASLTALGNVLKEANETLNGSDMLEIRVNADFIEGSFGYVVELIQNYQDAKSILDYLGFSIVNVVSTAAATGTVVGALQWLRGRDIIAVEDVEADDNLVSLSVDGETISMPREVADMVAKPSFRKSVEGLIAKPLESPGTTSFSILRSPESTEPMLVIEKKETSYYRELKILPIENENTTEEKIKFIAANIKGKRGWKAEVHGKVLTIQMHDDAFIERLSNRTEAYLFGKTFTVALKTTTTSRLSRESKVYTVTRVYHES
jgi:hypothetical protein